MASGSSFLDSTPDRGGSGVGGTAHHASLAHQLPKLTQETELQKLLADERMRSQLHRTHYEQLKEEHKRLQDEYTRLEDEIKKTIEESKIVQEKYKAMYDDAQRLYAERESEIEELRSKVVTPQRLEILRSQIVEDLERTYREKFQKQEIEIEEQRIVSNKLKYELSFLKSEYEHERLESQRILEELRLQHEAEVTNLRKERETTITRIQSENSQDSQRVRSLQRENAQLHLKIKGLTDELEEIRAQREKNEIESESVSRSQAKQLVDQNATIKSLEAERESLKRQVESVTRDFVSTGDTHNKLTSRIHELEKENVVLKNKADEVVHKSKVDLTNLKMDMMKQRGELERGRDKLSNLLDDMQTKLEISKHTIDQQTQLLADKEREAVRRVQGAREEEFVKFTKMETEKLELETKLQEIERRKIDEEAHKHAEREKVEERIRMAMSAKEAAEKEVLVFKTKITHHQSVLEQVDRERTENSELKSKINKLETELNSFVGNEHDMTEDNIRLRNQVELFREEVRLMRDQLDKAHNNHDQILAQVKAHSAEERTQLEYRVHELEEKLSQVNGKHGKTLSVHKKYKKKSTTVIESLKDKVQILQAKLEELELEKKALQKCVPQDTYNGLKKQLKDLSRRHNEFRKVMLSSEQQVRIGDMSFASVTMPLDCTHVGNYTFTEQERQHQEDLKLLKRRLDTLDDNQRLQLEELSVHEIAHSTLQTFPELDDNQDNSNEKADDEKAST